MYIVHVLPLPFCTSLHWELYKFSSFQSTHDSIAFLVHFYLIHSPLNCRRSVRAFWIVSWEPEGRYQYSKMFSWEPEGRYCCTMSINGDSALLALNWRYVVVCTYLHFVIQRRKFILHHLQFSMHRKLTSVFIPLLPVLSNPMYIAAT